MSIPHATYVPPRIPDILFFIPKIVQKKPIVKSLRLAKNKTFTNRKGFECP